MNIKFDAYIRGLPEDEQIAIKARAAELIGEELTLRDLRKARAVTQVKLAGKLGMQQDAISRLESQSDMLLSTLRKVVNGMGGDIAIIAKFPDRAPVRLAGIGEEVTQEPVRVGSRKPSAQMGGKAGRK